MAEPWLSADGIASHLGVTKDTIYGWIADKRMPAHKVGGPGSSRPARSMTGFEAAEPPRPG